MRTVFPATVAFRCSRGSTTWERRGFWDETKWPPSSPAANPNTWHQAWERLQEIVRSKDSYISLFTVVPSPQGYLSLVVSWRHWVSLHLEGIDPSIGGSCGSCAKEAVSVQYTSLAPRAQLLGDCLVDLLFNGAATAWSRPWWGVVCPSWTEFCWLIATCQILPRDKKFPLCSQVQGGSYN